MEGWGYQEVTGETLCLPCSYHITLEPLDDAASVIRCHDIPYGVLTQNRKSWGLENRLGQEEGPFETLRDLFHHVHARCMP